MISPLEAIDFVRVQERFDAYWQREAPGRPLVAITCPRDDTQPVDFPVPDTAEGRWTDIEYQCNRALWMARNTLYLGEAFPMFLPNIGPDSFTAYLGGELAFLDDTTSWVRPFVDDLEDYTPVFDRSSKWWRHMCDLMDALCEVCEGSFIIGIPDLHGGGDALAAMRHPDKFAVDLYDKPGDVCRLMTCLTGVYKEIFDDYYTRLSGVQDGSSTWVAAYSRGRYTALQNDFSGLISPRMFAEFFLPEVAELARCLDNSLYHLDGPGALGNLHYLLEIEELDGIQWVPGSGAKPMSGWLDVCRRVLGAGKCLHISPTPDEVECLLSELPHQGLLLRTSCGTEAEGRRLLETIEQRW